MKRQKIIARIVLLILSVINLALAAPVLVRGIREVRVDVVDAAEDVTNASRKRWNPSDKWRMNAADRANTPPSLGSRDSDSDTPSHPLPVGSPPPPAHNNLPLDIDLNKPNNPLPMGSPHPAQNNWPSDLYLNLVSHSPGSDDHDSHSTSMSVSIPSSYDNSVFNFPGSSGSSYSDDSDSNSGPTDDQPPPAPPSDPGSSKRPLVYPPLDPGPSKRPYHPSEAGPSTWAYYYPPPDPGPSTESYPPPDPGPSTVPTEDTGPSAPHSPPSPGPLQDESETFLSKLFKGRLKRRVSGSRSVNTGQRELQGSTLDSREYVSALPLPPTFQLP